MLNTRHKKKRTKHSGRASAELQRFLLKTGVLLAVAIFLFTCVLKVKRAEGNNMSPFVRDGDLCICLRTEKVCTGEVVIYRDQTGKEKIGRVVAIGGQTIDFPEAGGYTLDGYQPSEEIPYETYSAGAQYPLQLTGQEVFVLNDFRSLTDDSRTIGPVERNTIEGTLFFLLRRRGF